MPQPRRLVAPLLAPFVAACSSALTALMSSVTPLLTSLHAHGLSVSIRRSQYSRGCCDGEGGRFSEKGKNTSARDGFCFVGFAHGQGSTRLVKDLCGNHSNVPVLI